MDVDHLQHAGSAEIPLPHRVHTDRVIFQPLTDPAPENHRLPIVRDAMFGMLGAMRVGEGIEVNRTMAMVRNYCYRFRVETNRRHWRFRIRRAGVVNCTRVWRVNDVSGGE